MARLYSMADMARDLQRDAQNQRMREMMKAWDLEIAAAFERLRTQATEQNELKKAEGSEARRRQAAEAADAALAAAVTNYLHGLFADAADSPASITVPTGFRAASLVLAGPALGEINALLSDIQEAMGDDDDQPAMRAQASASWALGRGFAPHPGDLATVLAAADTDPLYADRFGALSKSLDGLDSDQPKHGQLKAYAGHQRIDLLKDHVQVVRAFGGSRLLDLLHRPGALADTSAKQAPPTIYRPGAVSTGVLHGVLDNLFGK